ncbi:transposase InsO family protein [Azospirillum agricola]|nr:transposase InsO family protein [Azospirillum agricola]
MTEAVNTMWGTDMTETITVAEGVARVFIAVDHANSEVVGMHASKSGNRFEALEPIRQGVLRHFGSIGPGVAVGLKLRHDHGSNYMSGDFQAEIKCLGITSSPSFVREPEGNGVAERFIRTLKENFCGSTPSIPSRTCAALWSSSPVTTTKPGSSPGMDIAPQPRCALTNSGLMRRPWPSYPWPPE